MGDFDLDKLLADENEYEVFVDKFKPKKTTDDCYTRAAAERAAATRWTLSEKEQGIVQALGKEC